ncbi:N-6 DNA methylase [Natrinema sp. H-ect4]|uniref:N-6 DNA methylase n=1 Tax=Natrinema sp. H-ect4 TaxID=3242699 RepID=UPI0035A9A664
MSPSNFTRELRELQGVTRVAELEDGLLLIDGTKTILLAHGGPRRGKDRSDTRLEVIEEEFDAADHLLASIEGAVLELNGTLADFEISYFPSYLGGVEREDLTTAIDELIQGSLDQEPLPRDYLSATECDNAIALFEQVLTANLTTYYTPQPVASLAANWATAGERNSVIDTSCGSGELLTAAVDAIGDPTHALGIDRNGLACAITETRAREQDISNCQIRSADFFAILDRILPDPHQSLNQSITSNNKSSSIPRDGFDCVFAHPPKGRSTRKDTQYYDSETEQFSRIEHRFVNAACRLLADSGRGCFILPARSIRKLRERVLPDGVTLKRLIKLPESSFPVIGVEPVLVYVERTSDDTGLGILNITSYKNLDQICGAIHSISVADGLDGVDAVSVEPDLSTTTVHTLLEAPGAAPFFTGDFPTLEDVTDTIAGGMITGHNRAFYFSESEKVESEIQDRFFTPVIKSIPEEGAVTEEHIDRYLFDLREFVIDHDLNERDAEEVGSALASVDPAAATYLEEMIAPAMVERVSLDSVFPRPTSLANPDLVTKHAASEITWHRVKVNADEVLYDRTVVGISCRDSSVADALLTLLNTPFYQRLTETQLPNVNADFVQVQIQQLQQLPILLNYLDKETFDQLQSLSPYESQESRETARTIILEGIDASYRSVVSDTYDAVSPLSTLAGYETQIEQLRTALNQVAEDGDIDAPSINEEIIYRLEETFRSAELFTSREQLVAELLTVYSEDRYWSFMGGTVSQFEGMLQDYIESTGGEVESRETDEGNTRLEYQYQGDWKPLRLKILLDDFFSGDLLNVMQSVREQRNKIAHGRLLEEPEGNADIILLSFFVFTYALLNEYNEYLGAEKAPR